MDECQAEMEALLSSAQNALNLDAKSVKLESNPQLGFFFRVTLKDEKVCQDFNRFSPKIAELIELPIDLWALCLLYL